MVDFSLSEAEREIAARARRVAEEVVAPVARAADAERRFSRDVVRAIGSSGLLGGPIAAEYGGLGLSYTAQALVYEEFGRVDSAVRGFMAVQTGLVASCIQEHASEEVKRRWLPKLCTAEAIGCFGLTESEAGSDPAAMQTRAVRDGDEWVIHGSKVWITNGSVADVCLLMAQTDPSLKGKGIVAFLLPTSTTGFGRERMMEPELGHRGADHARFRFEGMRVSDTLRLGEVGKGLRIAFSALDHGRLGVAAGALGVHKACLDACVAFAATRRQFGQPIGEFQMVQKTLADMCASYEAAKGLVLRSAWEKDRGMNSTRSTSIAKLFATEAAAKAAHDAVVLHGSRGYNNDLPLERHYRDIVGLEIYEGTSNIQRMIIARDLLREVSHSEKPAK